MFLSATRILLPVSVSVLVVIYQYFRSGQKSDISDGVEVPLNRTSVPSPAPSDPSDLDPKILDGIRKLDPAVLNRIRNLGPAFSSEISESVDGPLNPPSVPSPAPSDLDSEFLDWIRNLKPAVLDELQSDPAFLDWIRKLSLKKKEEKEEEEKRRECEKENEKERERESGGGGGGNDNGGEVDKKVVEESSRRNQYPLSESGSSSSGSGGGNENGGEVEEEVVEESSRRNQYPLRPEAGDCWYLLKTGNCAFGSNCKYNHLRRRKNKQVPKERVKGMDDSAKNPSQTECKYYLRSGGCQYGENCRHSHSREKPSVAPVLELNFLGLPIRLGKRKCPYYMRNGSCKYALSCRFNHPDPTATGGSDPPSGHGNGVPAYLQGASQSTVAPWYTSRPLNEAPVYSTLMSPPPQVVSSQNSEWNGYQAPAYVPERSMPARPPYMMNNSVAETNVYKPYPHQNQVEEFPERPGQPLCSYFLRKGDCKFKSNCKYHHPKTHTAVAHPTHTQ